MTERMLKVLMDGVLIGALRMSAAMPMKNAARRYIGVRNTSNRLCCSGRQHVRITDRKGFLDSYG
jgi:hypothetical protein